ncbi:MAG: NAD-dependent epimerase/dehydratase family protein [Lapillicoccus sp.]
MPSPILVTGGTGTLGRLVVSRLRDAGREVRVLSRHRADLGDGVDVVESDLTSGSYGFLRATGRRRLLLPVRLRGRAARAIRDGVNLAPDHADGRQTWDDFLAQRAPELVRRPSP